MTSPDKINASCSSAISAVFSVWPASPWLWHHPFLRTMTLLMMSSSLSLSGSSLAIIVLAQRRGASPWLIGCIFALSGVGSLIGALVAPAWGRRLLTRWTIALL
ncbi:MAG: hypothetical protein H0U76_11355 [Ktedonobacteraceae bacterium]|nr:hypothetical protein [Ktedonobacteraceae bacterium]